MTDEYGSQIHFTFLDREALSVFPTDSGLTVNGQEKAFLMLTILSHLEILPEVANALQSKTYRRA